MGISRVSIIGTLITYFIESYLAVQSTWEAAFIMGRYLDQHLFSATPSNGTNQEWVKDLLVQAQGHQLRVLELGSGTGLGGICLTKLLSKAMKQEVYEVIMTDICEKALDTIKTNLELN